MNRIAACGLYCGACSRFRAQKCLGCRAAAPSWCGVLKCCESKGIRSCGTCDEFPDLEACEVLNGRLGRVVCRLLDSDRVACCYRIRELGEEGYAQAMARENRKTLPMRR